MNQLSRLALKSLLLGVALELPFAIWGYAMMRGYNGSYATWTSSMIDIIIHAPAVIVLSLLVTPFASNSADVPLPMTAVFLTQAVLYSLLFLLILSIRQRRKSRTSPGPPIVN